MKTHSESFVKIWDVPTRVFHWVLVICCLGAILTQESERWRLVHVTLGYSTAGLVGFRVFWGFWGTRYARFGDFIKGPAAVKTYLLAARSGRPEHNVGHNPVGAMAVVAVLFLILALGLTGYLSYNELAGEWAESLHEAFANLLYFVVLLHILGVVFSSYLHRENLIRAMITGNKRARAQAAISRDYWWLGLLLLVVVSAFCASQLL